MPKNVSIVAETLLFNLYHTFRQRIKNGESRIEAIRFSKPLDESFSPTCCYLSLRTVLKLHVRKVGLKNLQWNTNSLSPALNMLKDANRKNI